MGQRHQLFVIARINGKYRCLAAVHQQSLYGRDATEICLKILKLLSSNLNRVPLQEELKLASTYNAEFWERGERIDYSYAGCVPRFPFITTCLCIGSGFDQFFGYQHKAHVEPWLMRYDEGHNNNGITIFDITDPSTPRYCFVDFHGMESQHKQTTLRHGENGSSSYDLPPIPPVTPSGNFFYPIQRLRPQTCQLRKAENGAAFVFQTTPALRDTWPLGDWQEPWQDQICEQSADEDSDLSISDSLLMRLQEYSGPSSSDSLPMRSQEDSGLSMSDSLQMKIDEDSDCSKSDSLQMGTHHVSGGSPEMPNSENAVTEPLRGGEPECENPSTGTQEAGHTEKESSIGAVGPLSLRSQTLIPLVEALVCHRELDEGTLSQVYELPDFWPSVKAALYKNAASLKNIPRTRKLIYQSLKHETHVDAGPFITISTSDLAIVLNHLSCAGRMQSLNLSDRPRLTKDELEVLKQHSGALRTLYLMGAPGSLSILDLIELRLPGDVYHHLLFKRALHQQDQAFHWTKPKAEPDMLKFMSEEHSVRHIAYVTIPAMDTSSGKTYLPDSGIDWGSLRAEASGPGYHPVKQRMRCMKYPLMGTPMPLPRLVIGIRNLFEWLTKGLCNQVSEISYIIASSFALGSSAQGSDPVNVGVGPLSNELYSGKHDYRTLRLAPREWSLIIIHPGPGIFPRVKDSQVVENDFEWREDVAYGDYRNKVYYAFVKCHGDFTDLSVHNLHGFLNHVGEKEADQLDALSEGWPGFHFYDRSDIGEALPKIYF